MRRGKGLVAERMPILRQDNVGEAAAKGVGDRDDLVAARHSESSAGAEVVLDVDEQ
jgi:hypothetical protein